MQIKYFLIILCLLRASENKKSEVPEWYINPPKSEDQYFAIGSGELKLEAMLIAIANLEQKNRIIVEGRDQFFKKESDEDFDIITSNLSTGSLVKKLTQGFFSMEIRSEDFLKEKSSKNKSDSEISFDQIYHLRYGNENQEYAFIQYFFKEFGQMEDANTYKNFEALFQNMDENKLIETLLHYGFNFIFSKKNGVYYSLLSIKK